MELRCPKCKSPRIVVTPEEALRGPDSRCVGCGWVGQEAACMGIQLNYDALNPGVRALVKELREVHGFNTTDSGDGTNLANGMEDALDERHVYMSVTPETFFAEGDRLQVIYPDAYVEASWWPGSGTCMLLLFPDGLKVPEGYSTIDPKLS